MRVNILTNLMPRRLTVGHDTLDVGILVRIQARQPQKRPPFEAVFLWRVGAR